jgi:hypothetical protein
MKLQFTSTPLRLMFPAVVAFIALVTNGDYLCDFWHHLARGRAIVQQGRLVNEDLFTFTVAGQPLVDVNWLTQVGYYELFQIGGLGLVKVCNALIIAATIALVTWQVWRTSKSAVWASGAGIIAFLGCWQTLSIRPQSVSMLFFAGECLALELAGRRRTWLMAPPLLALVWVNVHGAFPLAWVLVGIHFTATVIDGFLKCGWRVIGSKQVHALAGCLAVTMLATLVNPYGWHVYQYVGGTSSLAAQRHIDEWMPPPLGRFIGIMWLASLLISIVALARSRRRLTLLEALMLVAFAILAAGSVRMIVWWFLVLAPILAASLTRLIPRVLNAVDDDQPAWSNTICAAALALMAVICLPGFAEYNPLIHRHRTESDLETVAAQIRSQPLSPRIFSRFEWGEYLAWTLAGKATVFMDGRIEIVPDDVWCNYACVTCGGPNWQQILDRYRVDALILDATYHARTGLLAEVEHSPHWRRIDQQGPVVVFARTGEHSAAIVSVSE